MFCAKARSRARWRSCKEGKCDKYLHLSMKPRMYGDMNAFAEKLRSMGFADVRYVETAEVILGSKQRAAMMMLGNSGMPSGSRIALTNFIAAHKPTHIFSSPCTALIISPANEPCGSKTRRNVSC